MRVSVTIERKEVFTAYGVAFGKYFIGLGHGDRANIESAGLVWLFWNVYARVPYKYRQKINQWHKPKPRAVGSQKLFRVDLHLWEQRVGLLWKYTLWGKKPKYRVFKIDPDNARYLKAPYKYSNVR